MRKVAVATMKEWERATTSANKLSTSLLFPMPYESFRGPPPLRWHSAVKMRWHYEASASSLEVGKASAIIDADSVLMFR